MNKLEKDKPCPCGSGERYSQCCYIEEQQELYEEAKFNLLTKIINFIKDKKFMKELDWIYDKFCKTFDIDPEQEMTYYDYIAYINIAIFDMIVDEDNNRFIDLFQQEQQDELTDKEKEILEEFLDIPYSVYKVEKVEANGKIKLKNYYTKESLLFTPNSEQDFVIESEEIILARIAKIANEHQSIGLFTPVPPMLQKELFNLLSKRYKEYSKKIKEKVNINDFLRAVVLDLLMFAEEINIFFYEGTDKIVNILDNIADSDFCTAQYAIKSREFISEKIKQFPGINDSWREGELEFFNWFKGKKLIGCLIIDDNNLLLETDSIEMLEKGKEKIAEYLGIAAILVDEFVESLSDFSDNLFSEFDFEYLDEDYDDYENIFPEDLVEEILWDNMEEEYTELEMEEAIFIWREYKEVNSEIRGQAQSWSAGVEYIVNLLYEKGLTQKEIGNKYNVSVNTVSDKYSRILDSIDI